MLWPLHLIQAHAVQRANVTRRAQEQLTERHPRLSIPGTGLFLLPWAPATGRLSCQLYAPLLRPGLPRSCTQCSSQHARESISQSPEPSGLGPHLSTRARFLPSWNLSVLICKMEIITGLPSQGSCENVMSHHHRKYLALGVAHSKCSIKMLVLNEVPELASGLTIP